MASKKRVPSKPKRAPKREPAAKRRKPSSRPASVLLERLSNAWATARPGFERSLRKGATAAQLATFEKKLGLRLPEAFLALYSWHDGASDEHEVFEGPFGFCPLTLITKHKAMLDDVRGDDGTWDRAWVPFLQENYSDLVCVDTKSGEVFQWFNAEPRRVILAPTFHAWLEAHVAITEAAQSLADWDAVYETFNGPAAKKIRGRIAPGYPKVAPC